jgi:hypothetical protein
VRRRGHLLGGGAYVQNNQPSYALVHLDLDAPSPAPERTRLPFLPHGVSIDPSAPHRAAVFEKKGPGAALVDWRESAVERPIETAASRQFYGHGVFSADGALLYAAETRMDRGLEGVLVVRDARSLAELGELPTHGRSPHDCQLTEDGGVLVVANGGGVHGGGERGNIAWIELASGKLLERVEVADERFNAGHFARTGRDLAVVSAPRDGLPAGQPPRGAVSLRHRAGPLVTMKKPARAVERMIGETLSVVIDEERGVALATHPLGDAVTAWDLGRGALLELLEVPGPRGVAVAADRGSYLLSHLASGVPRLTEIRVDTRQPTGFRVQPSFLTGSHILVHAPGEASP